MVAERKNLKKDTTFFDNGKLTLVTIFQQESSLAPNFYHLKLGQFSVPCWETVC